MRLEEIVDDGDPYNAAEAPALPLSWLPVATMLFVAVMVSIRRLRQSQQDGAAGPQR